MGVAIKTIGELIDQLITADIKTFLAQDTIMDLTLSESVRLAAAETAQISNARRTALIRELDKRLGDGGDTLLEKTYG